MNARAKTVVLLIITGLLWSLGGVFIKTTDAHPFVISCLRSLVAAACLFAYLRGKPRFVFTRAQWTGALCYAATVTTFVAATKLTTSANAILLQYSSPIFVAILGWFILKDALYWYDFVSMGAVSVGLVLLLSGSPGFGPVNAGAPGLGTPGLGAQGLGSLDLGPLAGNILAVFSGFFYASLMVSLKMHKTGSQVETIILGNLIAVLFGLPFLFFYPITVAALAPIAFLGAFQIALPYALFAKASENASALDLALLPIIEPLLNPLWVFFATGEQPAASTYAGGAILLSVITLRSVIAIKSEPRT